MSNSVVRHAEGMVHQVTGPGGSVHRHSLVRHHAGMAHE